MLLHVHEPLAVRTRWWDWSSKELQYDKRKRTLGISNQLQKSLDSILPPDAIKECRINDQPCAEWFRYVPEKGDIVDVYLKVGYGLEWPTIIGLIASAVSVVASILVRVLTPTPKRPKQPLQQDTFGIAGITNTTGSGTPKYVLYGGPMRIFPHLIGTRTDVQNVDSAGGSRYLRFSALYFCADTGGDGVESMDQVELNGIKAEDIEGFSYEVRLGTDDQTVVPGFDSAAQSFNVNNELNFNTPVVYVTKFLDVNRITLIFQQVLYHTNSKGSLRAEGVNIKIELKKVGDPSFVVINPAFEVVAIWTSPTFYSYTIDTPSPGQYEVRLTNLNSLPLASTDPLLYNVQEEIFTTRNYPGCALLAIYGVPSSQVNSFDSLKTSLMMKGKKVKRPLGGGTELVWTNERMWHLWDIMTHPRVGLGHRIAESFFDTGAASAEQLYLNEMVTGHNGLEVRDECTLLVNERRPGWDLIKDAVLGEVDGVLFLSGGKLKPALKRPKTPNLMYSYPGNITEDEGGAVKRSISRLDNARYNMMRIVFQNKDNDFEMDILEIPDEDAVGEPVKDENLQYDSIKRISQVYRQGQIRIRENKLIRRRYVFKCDAGAQVSEPFDVDSLKLRGLLDDDIAASGDCVVGSTAAQLIMDAQVNLDPSYTYIAIVRHQDTNITERRQINETSGKHYIITPTIPFAEPILEHDKYAVGRQNIDIIDITAQNVKMSEEGNSRYEILVSEYNPLVWTEQPLPSRNARRYFNLGQFPPLPLASATIAEELGLNSSGVYESILRFDVVPALPKHAGKATLPAGFPEPINGIYLAAIEPSVDDYYNRWILRVVDGLGTNQPEVEISDYDGLTRFASCDLSLWTELPTSDSTYEIRKERYGSFLGFYIEMADELAGPWTEPGGAHFIGTTGRLSGPSLQTTSYFRFTPVSDLQIANRIGQLIVQFTAVGDLGVPGDVQNFNVVQMGDRVLFTWTKNADVDISHYQIRIGNAVANTWDMAMILADHLAGEDYQADDVASILIPPAAPTPPDVSLINSSNLSNVSTLTAFIKAFDMSGNESVNASIIVFDLIPSSDFVELIRRNELQEVSGIFTDISLREVDAIRYFALAPAAKWDTGGFWDAGPAWDIPSVLLGSYESQPLVLPRLGMARARMELGSPNFNGASYLVQESHSQDGNAYTPFKAVTTGDLIFRSAKLKFTLSAIDNLVNPLLNHVQSVVDAKIRSLLYSNKFVPAAGVTIVYDVPWLKVPAVHITSYSGQPAVIISSTETQLNYRIGTPGQDAFSNVSVVGV